MKKITFIIIAIFMGGLIQPAIAGHHKLQKLTVDMASIRAPIPGHSMTAAFLTINNTGKESCVLTSAASEYAEKIEFHTHQHINGMMKMRPVESVEVAVNSSLEFKPGGLHLMLFGVKEGHAESAEITLGTDNCGQVTFNAPIKSIKSAPSKAMLH
jgi:copper(I)-binding protein